MALTELQRQERTANVLKRLRENARLTTRQVGGLLGVTHTTISQFENGKREFSSLRIEQLVKAYGYTMEQFEKILGHRSVISYKDDCITMIGQLDDDQLAAVRSVLSQLLRQPQIQTIAASSSEEEQAATLNA